MAQKYIDEGGDDYKELDDALEDYSGNDPEMLADKYILRLMRDRYCDNDEDQDYIRTGWGKETDGNYQKFKELKEKYPNAVLIFRDGTDAYFSYEQDAQTLNETIGAPLLDWGGIKAAGFPHNALDINLPKLIRAGHRVAICDPLETIKTTKRKTITETVKPIRKQPIQLSLNF